MLKWNYLKQIVILINIEAKHHHGRHQINFDFGLWNVPRIVRDRIAYSSLFCRQYFKCYWKMGHEEKMFQGFCAFEVFTVELFSAEKMLTKAFDFLFVIRSKMIGTHMNYKQLISPKNLQNGNQNVNFFYCIQIPSRFFCCKKIFFIKISTQTRVSHWIQFGSI